MLFKTIWSTQWSTIWSTSGKMSHFFNLQEPYWAKQIGFVFPNISIFKYQTSSSIIRLYNIGNPFYHNEYNTGMLKKIRYDHNCATFCYCFTNTNQIERFFFQFLTLFEPGGGGKLPYTFKIYCRYKFISH